MTSRPLASVPRSSTGTTNSSPSRTALPAATSTVAGSRPLRITPLNSRRSSTPRTTSPGLRCTAPSAAHSRIIAIGRTAWPSMTWSARIGSALRSTASPKDRLEFPVRGRDRGRPGLAHEAPAPRPAGRSASTTISTGPGPASPIPDLVDDQRGPASGGIRCKPFLFEERPQRIGHHAAGPRSPVERDDATIRQPDGRLLRPLVEVLVGGGVGHLAGRGRTAPSTTRRARGTRAIPGSIASKRLMQALDLGVVDQVELRVGLIDDPPVRQDAGPVDQPPDRAELVACPARSSDARPLGRARRPSDRRPASRPRRCDRGCGGSRARARIRRTCSPIGLRRPAAVRTATADARFSAASSRQCGEPARPRRLRRRDCGRAPAGEAGTPRPGRRRPRR